MKKSTKLEYNKLHRLIWNMSKTDKTYLKKYSKIFVSKGETKHKIYYAILDKMEVFSMEKLKKKLEKLGGYRRFKNTEQELYSQILEDLVILKSKKRPTWQYLLEHMKSGYLFLEHNFEESLKQYETLYKLKEEAKNVTFNYLYYKYYYHNLVYVQNSRNYNDLEALKKVELELKNSIEDLRLEYMLEAAVHNFDIIRFSSFNKTKTQFLEDLKPYKKEYLDPLPKSLNTDKWKMLSVYYFCFCNYYLKTGDLKKLDYYSEKYYEEIRPTEIKNKFYHEFSNAMYFRIHYLYLSKNKEVYDLLEEFKEYIEKGKFFELKSFFHLLYCELALSAFIKFEDKQSLLSFIALEKEAYVKETKTSKDRITLNTDLGWALAYFELKQYKQAQPFLDKIFDSVGKIDKVFNVVLVSARVLDILIHFELKNFENIPYYIDSLEKELNKNNQLLAFDKAFLSHLKRLNRQLFSKQKLNKQEMIDFLENKSSEDRMNSYVVNLDVKKWLLSLEA